MTIEAAAAARRWAGAHSFDETQKDKDCREMARYILSLAPGKDAVEGAREALRRKPLSCACFADDGKKSRGCVGVCEDAVDKVAAFATAHAAKERADEREECAETCIRIWKEASNERTDSALTSYQQNALSHGCIASAAAIRSRSTP